MALMLFRERNKAKWVGIRPAHDGTQVYAASSAVNTTTTLYTVPAGKTLFLTFAQLTREGTGTGFTSLAIYDGVGALVATILISNAIANATMSEAASFEMDPWEVPEGYTVGVRSSAANTTARACIKGRIE